MEQRREAEFQEVDVASMGVLLGVVAASFVTLAVIIYFFGEDQTSAMAAAHNNPPAMMTERMIRNKSLEPATVPNTVGQATRP
jgi:hypothetical protein